MIKQPWPAMLRTIYGDDERYKATVLERTSRGAYFTGGRRPQDEDGYLLDHGPRGRRAERGRATASARWRSRAHWFTTRRSPRPRLSAGQMI